MLSWLCALATGLAARYTGWAGARVLAKMFTCYAIALSLFVLSVAQVFWFNERFPRLVRLSQCYFYGSVALLLISLALPLFPSLVVVLPYLAAFLLACLGLSLLLRLVLKASSA